MLLATSTYVPLLTICLMGVEGRRVGHHPWAAEGRAIRTLSAEKRCWQRAQFQKVFRRLIDFFATVYLLAFEAHKR
jgi:hypothetical protein